MDFLGSLVMLAIYFLITVPSAIIHEFAHGWMAWQLGDNTAKYAGRLTLAPQAHIDRWGTVILPVVLFLLSGGRFMFAYAKPVPYNPYNLRDQRWGPALVAAAGPVSNLLVAALFGAGLRWLTAVGVHLTSTPLVWLGLVASVIVQINILLAIFNLVPVPPLDGSKILYALLPAPQAERLAAFFDRFGIFILLIVIFYLFDYIYPLVGWLYNLFTGGF